MARIKKVHGESFKAKVALESVRGGLTAIQKSYLALASGIATRDSYDIQTPIGEHLHPGWERSTPATPPAVWPPYWSADQIPHCSRWIFSPADPIRFASTWLPSATL